MLGELLSKVKVGDTSSGASGSGMPRVGSSRSLVDQSQDGSAQPSQQSQQATGGGDVDMESAGGSSGGGAAAGGCSSSAGGPSGAGPSATAPAASVLRGGSTNDAAVTAGGAEGPAAAAAATAQQQLLRFAERHKRLLNAFVRSSHGKLLEGSLAVLLKSPWLLDFDNKKDYFRTKIRQRGADQQHFGSLRITVRRPYIIEDSFNQVRGRVTRKEGPGLPSRPCTAVDFDLGQPC